MRYQRSERIRDVVQDARYAARSLRRVPAYTAIVVAMLAVGIGATTAIFSAVNALRVRPLPYAEPDRLMRVSLTRPSIGEQSETDIAWSYPRFLVFRAAQSVFSEVSLYSEAQFNTTTDETERVAGEWITDRYLPTLGLSVSRGRNIAAAEGREPGVANQVLVSDGFWRRRLGAAPDIVGTSLQVNAAPFTIIGVLPRGLAGLSGQAELFLPITATNALALSSTFQGCG